MFSAGYYWTENPETYEDSFYKRSLDNENYVFTAPFFNSKWLDAQKYSLLMMFIKMLDHLKGFKVIDNPAWFF